MSTSFSEHFPEQLLLFDVGLNLSRLRLAQNVLMGSARAANTVKGYQHCWRVFERWCSSAGRDPLPASSDSVGLFVSWSIDEGYRLATVKLSLAAIAARLISLIASVGC